MADFNTDTAESNSLEDLILLDNFQKEDSSHNAPPGTPSSEAYSLYSSSLVDIGKTRTHDDNVELYDIIARDNFTAEDAYTAGISDTVLANLPSEVAQGLKTDAPQKTLPTLPDATSTQSLSGVLNISETPDATHEEYTTLVTYCDETRARLKAKSELRKSNLMPARDESKLSKLDSSLKKNSAFVKKLKTSVKPQTLHMKNTPPWSPTVMKPGHDSKRSRNCANKEKKEGKEKEEVKEKDDGKEKEQSPVTSEPGGGGLGGGINVNNVVKGGGIDTFLANLYKCENREMMDNAAVEFIMYYNTRTNRKKLTSTLLY
ncbi:regulator of nonsense transcripts UPF2-like [Diaphorina citri]|uniref:Regulator of nonsense transcripts UPF2-like n=1 Tax=Diaphorina citri TaxID=121845 RepID=A0A3Q0JIX0_DIACI|nr:regulator of nonsense transcripts UPF2-like [Diaphorina citri]